MNQKVKILSDSTVDLGEELISRYGITVLPLGVTLGGKSYTDGVDMTPDGIYEHYEKTGELPKTSAINVADFQEAFEKATKEGIGVVCLTISSQMSSTYQNALLAAQGFSHVHVVDTGNLSTGGGLLTIYAAELAEEGKSAEEIARLVRERAPFVDASFVVDDLEFLYKGGRCSALAAFGANLLQLKPCITVKEGKMGVDKKYRGKFSFVLSKYVADRLGDGSGLLPDHVFVTHAGCDEKIVSDCVEAVKALGIFREVHVTRAGCTISSHCGRNTLGVLFIHEPK